MLSIWMTSNLNTFYIADILNAFGLEYFQISMLFNLDDFKFEHFWIWMLRNLNAFGFGYFQI